MKRNAAFDLVKLIAMFMVVLGHTIGYRPGFNLATTMSYPTNFIIATNMPLFFMVSGYFSDRLHTSLSWRKLIGRLICYFWPLAFFSVLFATLDCFVWAKIQIVDIPIAIVRRFLFGGWFFYALAFCDVATFLANCFGKKPEGIFSICVACYMLVLLGSGRVWHAQNIVAMIPFYWFGLWVFPRLQSNVIPHLILILLGGAVMLFVTFFAGNIATNGLSFYWNRFDILHPNLKDMYLMFLRYAVGILGSLFVIYVVILTMKKLPFIHWLAFLGTETLGIYFLQGNIIQGFVNHITTLESSFYELFTVSAIVYILSFYFVKATKMNRLIYIIVWGKGLLGMPSKCQ